MSADNRGTKILTRSFFNQLKSSGYDQNQIIRVATELLDLVTSDLRDGKDEQQNAPPGHRDVAQARA